MQYLLVLGGKLSSKEIESKLVKFVLDGLRLTLGVKNVNKSIMICLKKFIGLSYSYFAVLGVVRQEFVQPLHYLPFLVPL